MGLLSGGRRVAAVAVLAAAVLLTLGIRRLRPERAAEPPPRAPAAAGAGRLTETGTAPVERATCAGPPPAAENAGFEQEILQLVNDQRRTAGLPPLKPVEPLTGSARWFARDMATNDYSSPDHDTYYRKQGQLVRGCAWSARIGWFYPGWTSIAENIASGYATPRQVVEGWMQSPVHRGNILSPGEWETGVGYWSGGSEGSYWVQDFGRRE